MPDSGSETSSDEDPVGFGGLTGAGAHIGIGAALYLQTTKTMTILFFILTILNIPIYLIYNSGTSNNDFHSIDRMWHYFGIGNLRGRTTHCNSVPIQFDDLLEQDSLNLQCSEPDQYISKVYSYGYMNHFDPRTQSPSDGQYQCDLITIDRHLPPPNEVTISINEDFADSLPDYNEGDELGRI